ncbi:uncharacterized protein LOC113500851 [Trichoplusia ni]|uniref:Uncharacterized protein LOC113500851 n=1 Tax=Trichoplusia ni TaxID=7111 RepID=A0A7E5WA43_TRINI|nr:uncharacterized protein LOC113500851 [Trichoplusia ni]
MASFKRVSFAVTLLVIVFCAEANGSVMKLKIPEACHKEGFCSIKPEGYDKLEEKINRLLTPPLVKSFSDRIGQNPEPELSPEEDWHNCPYIKVLDSSYTFSYEMGNRTDTDIIIQTKLLSQPIETVKCAYEKINRGTQECFKHLQLHTYNMMSSCETSTVKRSLLIYDEKADMIKLKEYDIPCCCTCVVRNV